MNMALTSTSRTDPAESLTLEPKALDRLMPMHLVVAASGEVLRMGPSLQKVMGAAVVPGTTVFDLFLFRRPRNPGTLADLLTLEDGRLRLRPRAQPKRSMKALVVSLEGNGGALLNLSFGISVIDAVRDHNLTAADFAVTDLTVEMLYLMEAKSAALEESRRLNLRLQGAKLLAEEQAFTDTLTGLCNRRAMDNVLAGLVSNKLDFAVMHLDLDLFKEVNDTHGHAAGDEVLSITAQRLVAQTRGSDTVARIGGDEFVLIFPGLLNSELLSEIATRIITRLEEPMAFAEEQLRISASIGITTTAHYASPVAETVLHDADTALYASKRAGRGRHSHFRPTASAH